jgi:folate-dependent phosphoribosylglycinamide formyltransferase PurN
LKKIVIVTGESPHHKQLIVRLAEHHHVVGILHPVVGPAGGKLHRLRSWARGHGWPLALLSATAALPKAVSGWTMKQELAKAEERYERFVAEYEKLDKGLIHRAVDVKSAAACELMSRLDPDVVVTLGGPLYPSEFIASCRLMLNFHSGLSPIYNGSSTINFAFANGHPHLCGGTLMKMSSVIDGGAILAHYLPSVDAGDGPASLFMKTVGGAATLYKRFLDAYSGGSPPRSIPQAPPLFYYRHMHWSLYQTQFVNYYLKTRLANKHLRAEKIVEYWNTSTDSDARDLYRQTIDGLLWGGTQ